jgi:hypothetical protein
MNYKGRRYYLIWCPEYGPRKSAIEFEALNYGHAAELWAEEFDYLGEHEIKVCGVDESIPKTFEVSGKIVKEWIG